MTCVCQAMFLNVSFFTHNIGHPSKKNYHSVYFLRERKLNNLIKKEALLVKFVSKSTMVIGVFSMVELCMLDIVRAVHKS